jgi:hypothetical protein
LGEGGEGKEGEGANRGGEQRDAAAMQSRTTPSGGSGVNTLTDTDRAQRRGEGARCLVHLVPFVWRLTAVLVVLVAAVKVCGTPE